MRISAFRNGLTVTTILSSAALLTAFAATPAFAQTADTSDSSAVETVVVTGSRIHRDVSDTTTAAPLNVINAQELSERGYVQAGEALNKLTSMTPSMPITPHNGASSGNGQQFPNLFNLGPERTLTLVNGRRFVGSGTGLNGNTVDTNMIPVGLLDRVEVVLGGGSVVYGSDAIAGVVNYVLKDHFTGVELDAQTGITDRGDYPQNAVRVTGGLDFLGGRGNIAADIEWAKSDSLVGRQRTNLRQIGYTGADSTPPGSASAVYGLTNSTFWEFNKNGVLFVNPPGTLTPTGYQAAFGGAFLVTSSGQHYGPPGAIPQQFKPDGSGLMNYDLGTNPPSGATQLNIPFSSGGDGFKYRDLGSLLSGDERRSANVIGHIDITPTTKLSTELLYGHTVGIDPNAQFGNNSNTVLNNQQSGGGAVIIKASNPYLPASARDTIANYLNTTFGGLGGAWLAGAPLPAFGVGLSKAWSDLLPSYADTVTTDTVRGLVALDGSLHLGVRDYYWSLSASIGHSESTDHHYDEVVSRFNNAVDTTTNGAGEIVCAINAVTVTDPACTPLNPFTEFLPSATAGQVRSYVSGIFGQKQFNTQQDYLATFGGPLATLPGGDLQFSATYEHRVESAQFRPTEDTSLGLGPSGTPTAATSGRYSTNEGALEFLAPVIGKEYTLPGVQALELNGAYRYVSNSVSGDESVWDLGGRWTIVDGLTLRGSRSRNFRAPSLYQLFDPATTALSAVGRDPCDSREINSGPGGSVNRIANCTAEFAAHPGYAPLSTFQDLAQNFSTAAVTTKGNAALKNEVSNVWTYGAVIQPDFLPGLTFTVDRIEIKLANALTQVTPDDVMAACYDSTPAAFAASTACTGGIAFTRDSTGQIVAATSSFLNAAIFQYKGETYNLAYEFDVSDLWGDTVDRGHINANLQATHTEMNNTQILGNAVTKLAGTAQTTDNAFGNPRWVTKLDIGYSWDALGVSYEMFYLPKTRVNQTATLASTPYPEVEANIQHSISAQYVFNDNFTVRAGITNFTNEKPSFPLLSYGDAIGRRYFLGINVKY